MKVETKPTKFTPLVITLESIEEVMILKNIIGPTTSSGRWGSIHQHPPIQCPFQMLHGHLSSKVNEHTES